MGGSAGERETESFERALVRMQSVAADDFV